MAKLAVDFAKELCEAIGVDPNGVARLEFIADARTGRDNHAIINIEYYADEEKVVTVLKRYRLEEIDG